MVEEPIRYRRFYFPCDSSESTPVSVIAFGYVADDKFDKLQAVSRVYLPIPGGLAQIGGRARTIHQILAARYTRDRFISDCDQFHQNEKFGLTNVPSTTILVTAIISFFQHMMTLTVNTGHLDGSEYVMCFLVGKGDPDMSKATLVTLANPLVIRTESGNKHEE